MDRQHCFILWTESKCLKVCTVREDSKHNSFERPLIVLYYVL